MDENESQSHVSGHGHDHEFKIIFSGKPGEYFRIWIVNIFLSLVTAGIYSAWAKIRSRRYFYGNTQIENASFDYTGNPIAILKGRLLIGAIFVLHYILARISPYFGIATWVIFIVLFPWIYLQAMSFNLSNTIFRSIRFGFDRDYKEAYRFYFLYYIVLCNITLGLGLPYAIVKFYRFTTSHTYFGTERMRLDMSAKDAYLVFLKVFGPFFIAALVLWLLMLQAARDPSVPIKFVYVILAAAYLVLILGAVLYLLYIQKVIWRGRKLGSLRFELDINPFFLIYLALTNFIAILFSAGMLIPWTKVRNTRYYISRFKMWGTSDALNGFEQGIDPQIKAFGDASADFWEVDLGF